MRMKVKQLKHHPKGARSLVGQSVRVKGWVRTQRKQKNFTFLEVNDGSMQANLQVLLEPSLPQYEKIVEQATTGASVVIKGTIVESPGEKQDIELKAEQIVILGLCDPAEYPLQKKKHSFEFLREIAHLRSRTNTIGAVMRIRNAMAMATHMFFQSRGFIWLHTPIITGADCEGAGEMFRVTSLDMEQVPRNQEGKIDDTQDFFGKPTFLTVSGQLNGEIYALAMSDIYTFGPTFRAENSNTSRHLAEFWMIEPEMAFADLSDNMQNAEEYLKFVINYLLGNYQEDLQFFDRWISKGLIQRLEDLVKTPFEHTSYTFAIRILERSNKNFEYPVAWGKDLQSEHERYLAEEYFKKPIIITDYPKEAKAFYMRQNEDEKTVAAMDVIVPKIGEIIGGSQREERLERLERRMDELHLNKENYWWYLDLRRYGSVPHAGYGVGFERFVQFATGLENIRETIPFPRYPGKAEF